MKLLTNQLTLLCSLILIVFLSGNMHAQTYSGQCVECEGQSDDYVFSDAGGFIMTCGMLKKQFYEIVWAGTHNSFANNDEPDVRTNYVYNYLGQISTKNQDDNIQFQIESGVRLIGLDLIQGDNNTFFSHGALSFGKTGMEATLSSIATFLAAHPKEILIVNISFEEDNSDWWSFEDNSVGTSGRDEMMADFYTAAVSAGLWDYVVQGDLIVDTSHGKSFVPNDANWPTIEEMINADERLILLPKGEAPFSLYASRTNDFKTTNDRNSWRDYNPDEADVQAPSKGDYTYSSYTIYVNPNPGNYTSADRDEVERTNEAVILYELGVKVQDDLATLSVVDGADYHLSYFQTNFYQGSLNHSSGKRKGLSVVDACNRLNFDRFAYKWSTFTVGDDLYWDELSCFAETAEMLWNTNGLEAIRPSTYSDWGGSNQDQAVNEDFFDYWDSKNKNGGNDWDYDIYFDLGRARGVNGATFIVGGDLERIKFYGSNDKSNWSRLLGATDVSKGEGEGLWEYFQFDENLGDYRYIYARLDKAYSSSKEDIRLYDFLFLVDKNSIKSASMIEDLKTEISLATNSDAFQCEIFPNPSHGEQLNVQLNGVNEGDEILVKIMDISGRMVYTNNHIATAEDEQISLTNLNLDIGSYIVAISGREISRSIKLSVK